MLDAYKDVFPAKLPKCEFMQPELKFLGHSVGARGLQVDPRKVAIVQDWPVPTGIALLRSFLGLANYFRKFTPGWAALVASLQYLTKKDKSFVWSAECDESFKGVKKALTSAPVLALADLRLRGCLGSLFNGNTEQAETMLLIL